MFDVDSLHIVAAQVMAIIVSVRATSQTSPELVERLNVEAILTDVEW
jgi:hypothetical protein